LPGLCHLVATGCLCRLRWDAKQKLEGLPLKPQVAFWVELLPAGFFLLDFEQRTANNKNDVRPPIEL
jgi:hypothetical protein